MTICYNSFIYGKDSTEKVVSVNVEDGLCTLFLADGREVTHLHKYYILYKDQDKANSLIALNGNLHYKFVKMFDSEKDYRQECYISKARGIDFWTSYNPSESFMLRSGVTHYKGMKPEDLAVLSFDIETEGLNKETNRVLMITTTTRQGGKIERRLYSLEEYNSEQEMIYAWCNFVNDFDPHIIVGHNIFGFDLPFLEARAGSLPIGKHGRPCEFNSRASQFRKDGSQSYDYFNAKVYGREVIDTFFLSIKYDVARNYPSYRLKEIIKYEGLERADRQYYDASKIKDAFGNVEEWEKVKRYAEHDADDSLALFDLMIPSYFYFTQTLPRGLQSVINGASGSQINAFMIRAYLSDKHSIPKASEAQHFEGAISYGNPGIYHNVGKYDVASLYPSIILQENIYDRSKDPKAYFLKMVRYFTEERLRNKKLSKDTGDRYYKDLEQSQKITINSAYGFLGAHGLNFNAPSCAADVTRHGRIILERGIDWAGRKGWGIVNADTDSFSFTTGDKFDRSEFKTWLDELNALYPPQIKWEEDGIFDSVLVVKAKNYVLRESDSGKIKIKGSALKATMKEPALIKFIDDVIKLILDGRKDDIRGYYTDCVRDIFCIGSNDISAWASKRTITKSVLNPERTNERRVKEAIERAGLKVQEGDKIFIFFRDAETLEVVEAFDGTYCTKKLLGKLYNTIKIFESILDISEYPNYTLKKHSTILEKYCA